jgi:hypothetical protein
MESHRPFTLNKQYSVLKETYAKKFEIERYGNPPANARFQLQDSDGNSHNFAASDKNFVTILTAYGFHISSPKQLSRIHLDEYRTELEVISHVSAYFEIASRRIIDDIPKVFETIFALNFGRELGNKLAKNLKLVGDGGIETCKGYVRDEPEIQAKRDCLTEQQEILTNALLTVDQFFRMT